VCIVWGGGEGGGCYNLRQLLVFEVSFRLLSAAAEV